ncbi:response regulator [Candidatus Sumerlaeota bacterium]
MTEGSDKFRLLLVDDDPEIVSAIVEALSLEFEVIGAMNGMECLEKLDLYEPDLVLLDIMMPGVDGLGACRAIRKNARFSDMPIFLLTARDDPEIHQAVKEYAVACFLRKPTSPSEIRQAITTFLEQTGVTARDKVRTLDEIEEEAGDVLWGGGAAPKPVVAAASAPTGPRARIVVIDDEREIIDFVTDILSTQYEVIGLTNPVTAVDKLVKYEPELILIDTIMPGLSGYQLSQLLRMKPSLAETKVLFVSSRESLEELEYATRLGAVGHLVKPFSREELLRRVQKVAAQEDFGVGAKRLSLDEIKRLEQQS